jgi:hypothetical protein
LGFVGNLRTIEGLTNKTKKLDEMIESQSVKINDLTEHN